MTSLEILTEEELCPVAAAWGRHKLIKWLDGNRIPYVIAASGWPRVHRKALERALGVSGAEAPQKSVEFNFEAIK